MLKARKAPPAVNHKEQKVKWKQYSQCYRDKLKNDPTLAKKQKVEEHDRTTCHDCHQNGMRHITWHAQPGIPSISHHCWKE